MHGEAWENKAEERRVENRLLQRRCKTQILVGFLSPKAGSKERLHRRACEMAMEARGSEGRKSFARGVQSRFLVWDQGLRRSHGDEGGVREKGRRSPTSGKSPLES